MTDDDPRRRFFLQPHDPTQRRYEAIRAVVIEGLPIQQAAERFGFAYGTLRNLLSQFSRQTQDEAPPAPPPFSPRRDAAGRQQSGPATNPHGP